ncbi:4,5-dihydroxyphthalate decarboxylase [Pigmentiphaga humi]|uniref:4,5-dihydroxyphthalate decarboxylase n=2 Tax=Pigmentiphaga humi TaxID=2478468 RepID=A0A3P4AY96_9BURK|nr:4,5-dihydroxyphthalate decarboxylase [Pigmentiphaga humi]
MFGSYPKTAALKNGQVGSSSIELDIAPVEHAQSAFKDTVRKHAFDVSELAVVTYLLAVDAGHPYRLLPFVMNGNFHHKSIYARADDLFTPAQLKGRRVAMRSYSQTTPTWVRGILCDEHGLSAQDVEWWSQEGAHVAEYRDPDWVRSLDEGANLEQALLAGQVDAIIAGAAVQNKDRLRHVIDAPQQAAQAWHARTGVIPINHMVVVRDELVRNHPEAVAEVYRMLVESRRAAGEIPPDGSQDLQPFGFEAIDASLRKAIDYTYAQGMIKRRYTPEELYGGVRAVLA